MTSQEEEQALAGVYAELDQELADRIWKAEREAEQWKRRYSLADDDNRLLSGLLKHKNRTIERLTKENEQLRDENNTLRGDANVF